MVAWIQSSPSRFGGDGEIIRQYPVHASIYNALTTKRIESEAIREKCIMPMLITSSINRVELKRSVHR
jgi:hypothetical protein